VQPQLAEAAVRIRSASPVFVKEKMHPTFSPALMDPKLCSSSLNSMTAVPVVSVATFLPGPEALPPHDDANVHPTRVIVNR
jgi:hypothetical protein